MNKKTHLLLAKEIIRILDNPFLSNQKRAFCVGSILPDCTVTFLYRRHRFDRIWEETLQKASRLQNRPHAAFSYALRLGVILHFIADFFTLPHNVGFQGGLKAHNQYERLLYRNLGGHLRTWKKSGADCCPDAPQDIRFYIQTLHDTYLQDLPKTIFQPDRNNQKAEKLVDLDCFYILQACIPLSETILRSHL